MAAKKVGFLAIVLTALGLGVVVLASWLNGNSGGASPSEKPSDPAPAVAQADDPNQAEADAGHSSDLTFERFEAIRQLIQPRREETGYLSVPWETSLWEARKRAAREGKPILLWEMDGHPLGCT
ncbi:hypothetical protein Isop_3654 [Isosphaera pallida ATCC 43644]|jgi:hypothetical protein|uniref:Uncharacterized protein n=1 Tax=Isosphaera pallida (strain ATCC 43644 / DSM 9630 / IS1B) TaxID=575540 RepID=E8QZ81_ISOPI|nr:hypothetical protein [Isosphaera pallida]ADV64210.1 hypothetical protein Isop_3654 [Isosphaera pallida ATCC 43644]